jgi:hypothetical protein
MMSNGGAESFHMLDSKTKFLLWLEEWLMLQIRVIWFADCKDMTPEPSKGSSTRVAEPANFRQQVGFVTFLMH